MNFDRWSVIPLPFKTVRLEVIFLFAIVADLTECWVRFALSPGSGLLVAAIAVVVVAIAAAIVVAIASIGSLLIGRTIV